jgi:hypothetical protein
MPISGYFIFIVIPFTVLSQVFSIIMDHVVADSKNYSPEMKSAFSAGGCTPKRSGNREK